MRKKETSDIDFVLLWVDGEDPVWKQEKDKYLSRQTGKQGNGTSDNRFRDWGLLRYWFRGVEKFAPWVRRIYFITWGHYPLWLNVQSPQLRIINHETFIPEKFLPTFNSNVIELNLHRISSLSEKFVLFNDDMFLTAPVKERDFFQGDLPCETALMDTPSPDFSENIFPHMMLNNAAIINQHFSKKEVLKKNGNKFFRLEYGKGCLRNLLLMPLETFSCFRSEHTPISHLKSDFFRLWEEEKEILTNTGMNRFRSAEDVTHWLLKDWRLCEGRFVPRKSNWGHCFELGRDDLSQICRAIEKAKYKEVCLNDSGCGEQCMKQEEFVEIKKILAKSLETIFPYKSRFEL